MKVRGMAVAVMLSAASACLAEEGRTDWVPNAHTALAVHWDQTLAQARKEFESRGFEGISGFGHYPYSDERNCTAARKVARDNASVKEQGCYAFVDGGPFAGWENNCRIYWFQFERYAGSEHVDRQHPRNCHNMR